MELTLTLPVQTIQLVLNALAKLPYETSAAHIRLIEQKAGEAAAAQQEPPMSEGGTAD
jgi:hypothetical protein